MRPCVTSPRNIPTADCFIATQPKTRAKSPTLFPIRIRAFFGALSNQKPWVTVFCPFKKKVHLVLGHETYSIMHGKMIVYFFQTSLMTYHRAHRHCHNHRTWKEGGNSMQSSRGWQIRQKKSTLFDFLSTGSCRDLNPGPVTIKAFREHLSFTTRSDNHTTRPQDRKKVCLFQIVS